MKYLGVGTVEFLYEDGGILFHRDELPASRSNIPSTEMITDIGPSCLEQIRIAARRGDPAGDAG